MSQMGAQVVPAKLRFGTEHAGRKRSGPRERILTPWLRTSAPGSPSRKRNRPDVIPAKAVQHRAKPPMLVRSSLASDRVAPPTVFLVMRTEFVQTQQHDGSGPVVWGPVCLAGYRDWPRCRN